MSSIKDKLRGIQKSVTQTAAKLPVRNTPESRIEEALDAQIVENEYGRYLLREKRYSLDFVHGEPLIEFLSLRDRDFVLLGKAKWLSGMDHRKIVFFDTETTGLAGGAGTCPFLVGTGFFQDNEFVVRQYFMRDFDEEAAMLSDLAVLFTEKTDYISFNGKSYDLPVLKNRFVLSRMKSPFDNSRHLDLLHASRRLWKQVLDSCTLQNLEKTFLGFQRVDDVPGYEIPEIYFNFLRTGYYDLLVKVFKHNVMDILSMVSVSVILARYYHKPPSELSAPVLHGILQTLSDLGKSEQVLNYCESFLQAEQNANNITILQIYGFYLKKLKRHSECVTVWLEMIRLSPRFNPLPYIELAKVYEHHLKDYQRSLEIVNRALDQVAILADIRGHIFHKEKDDLEYRKQRLQKRIAEK